MAFIPTPNCAKVCLRFSNALQQVCNVFHVQVDTPADIPTLQDIAEVFATWWVGTVKPHAASTATLEAVEVTDMSAEGAAGIVYTTGLPQSGSHGGAMPNSVTLAVKLATGLTGRSNRGRSYVVGLPDTDVAGNGNFISGAAQTFWKGAYEALIDALITNGVPLVINSLFHNGAPRTEGITTEVTSVSVNPVVDSQRRRLPERGA